MTQTTTLLAVLGLGPLGSWLCFGFRVSGFGFGTTAPGGSIQMSPRPHRPAKSCSSHNRFLLNYRLPVRGSRARPMVSRSRPSIWYPPCTRQSLHKAVRHINAAAATRKDKVGRPTMFRTARLSQAVTGVVGEKTARARGAIEEHPRSTRGTLESASQASGYQRTCATLAPRALSGMRTNLPPGPGLFTAQFLRCTNVT